MSFILVEDFMKASFQSIFQQNQTFVPEQSNPDKDCHLKEIFPCFQWFLCEIKASEKKEDEVKAQIPQKGLYDENFFQVVSWILLMISCFFGSILRVNFQKYFKIKTTFVPEQSNPSEDCHLKEIFPCFQWFLCEIKASEKKEDEVKAQISQIPQKR